MSNHGKGSPRARAAAQLWRESKRKTASEVVRQTSNRQIAELLSLAKSGDRRAREDLAWLIYECRWAWVTLCGATVMTRSESDDIQSRALLVFATKLKEIERVEPWIRRVAMNQAKQYLAKEAGERRKGQAVGEVIAGDGERAQTISSAVADRIAGEKPFGLLSPKQQIIVETVEQCGGSIAEAARLLGWPENTVGSSYRRAMEILRQNGNLSCGE